MSTMTTKSLGHLALSAPHKSKWPSHPVRRARAALQWDTMKKLVEQQRETIRLLLKEVQGGKIFGWREGRLPEAQTQVPAHDQECHSAGPWKWDFKWSCSAQRLYLNLGVWLPLIPENPQTDLTDEDLANVTFPLRTWASGIIVCVNWVAFLGAMFWKCWL